MTDRPEAPTPDLRDSLGLAVIALARELWVVKDRQIVTEAILRQNGWVGDVDAHQPALEVAERLASERQRFLESLTSALFTKRDPGA